MTRPLRTLVVDDHQVNRLYLETLLSIDGHPMHSVVNGQQAVDAARTEVFDLVLMDLHMPVMDGETAIRHIRALPAPHGSGLIIAVTADGAQATRQRVFAAGADDFLEKPVEATTLRAAIARGLQRLGTPPASAAEADDSPLDAARLAELRAAIPESDLQSLLNEVLESPESGLHALLRALERADARAAAAAAHKLKGSCMMMGLRLLKEAAYEAEMLLRADPPPDAATMQGLCAPLREKADRTRAAMQTP